jgi:DNA-binding MarR family transcriptional regulator
MAEATSDEHWAVPELIIRFLRAAHELNRGHASVAGGPTPQQIRAMVFLIHHPGPTLKELAEALSLSETRASRLIDELEEAGHVSRDRDAIDRRQVRIHVTPASEARAREMYHTRWNAVQRALSGATPDEIAAFTRIFARIVEQFEAITPGAVSREP